MSDARLLFRTGFGSGKRTGRPRSRRLVFWGVAVSALAALPAFSAEEAQAEVVVQRDHDEIRVNVENDTVAHVLEALVQDGNCHCHYRSTAPLDKIVGGSFSGSWGQVLSRVLAGFDFVVAYRQQGVEIVILEESGGKPVSAPPTESSQPQTAPPAVEQATPGVSLAPRRLTPRAPSEYDMATSNLLTRRGQSGLQEGQR